MVIEFKRQVLKHLLKMESVFFYSNLMHWERSPKKGGFWNKFIHFALMTDPPFYFSLIYYKA